MSADILGYVFDDCDEQTAEALETIIAHLNIDEDILNDYLFCCEHADFTPETVEELASYVLSPAMADYHQTNFDYPNGYPADDTAYEDIGHYLLEDTDVGNYLCKSRLDFYFDFEQYGRDYLRNNACELGGYGYLAEFPRGNIIISKDEIVELANYLSGHAYNPSKIAQILPSINADILDCSEVVKADLPYHMADNVVCAYKPPEERVNSSLSDDLKAATQAANRQTQQPTSKHQTHNKKL